MNPGGQSNSCAVDCIVSASFSVFVISGRSEKGLILIENCRVYVASFQLPIR